jgi:SAM-dependent methyltransferase
VVVCHARNGIHRTRALSAKVVAVTGSIRLTGQIGTVARYDEIADWYETEFLATHDADPLRIQAGLRDLLGPGDGGVCLEIGCGTGVYATVVRASGWTPVGVDLSARMLGYSTGRLPAARADATKLPVRDASVAAVITVMAHTDMPAYPDVVGEAARVLRPGGVFVHVGVHPCFCGGFADRTVRDALVIRPGYLDTYWTRDSWSDNGVRDKVGAMHRPLPALMHAFLDAGLVVDRFAEEGRPTPIMLAVRLRKPAPA